MRDPMRSDSIIIVILMQYLRKLYATRAIKISRKMNEKH